MPKAYAVTKKSYKKTPYKAKPKKYTQSSWLIRNAKLNKKGEGVYTYERSVSTSYRDQGGASNLIALDTITNGGFTMSGLSGPYINIYFAGLNTVNIQQFTSGGGLGNLYTFNIPSVSEFISLYRFYKINWVEMTFVSSAIATPTASGGVLTASPYIGYVKNYEENGYQSLSSLEQYPNYQIWQPGTNAMENGMHKIYLKPKPTLQSVNSNGTASGTAQVGSEWITTHNGLGTEHYGLKMAYVNPGPDTAGGNVVGYIAIRFKYNLSFKDVD